MLNLTILATRLLLGLVALVTLLPTFSAGFWVVRLCDFPRAQFAAIALLPLCGLLVWGRHTGWSWEHTCLTTLCFAIIGWQLSHIVRYTPLWAKELADAADSQQPVIRVAVVNLRFENEKKEQVAKQLESLDVELLLLIEVDQAWQQALPQLESRYPWQVGVVREEGLGIMLWSKLELVEPQVQHLVSADRASICTKLTLGDQQLNFVGVHPTPPGLPVEGAEGRHDSRIRDAELMLIAKAVADRPSETWIVTGDFNDVAWSHTTRLFKRISGLQDPRVGRGLFNTYHAQHPLLRFPIDQVFMSPGAQIHNVERFRPSGSDHFAICTSFSLITDQSAQPTASGDDLEEAAEMVVEGSLDARQTSSSASN